MEVGAEMSWEAIAAFISLGLVIITSVVLTMRGLAKIEINLRNYFDSKQDEAKKNVEVMVDRSKSEFGESVRAIREHSNTAHERIDRLIIKIQEVELYIRDNYIEVPSFDAAMSRFEKVIDGLDGKLDKLMDKD